MRALLFLLTPLLAACSSQSSQTLGIQNQALMPCPDSPNCVSSFASNQQHKIDPLNSDLEKVKEVLSNMDNVSFISEKSDYLHTEFKTRVMGFIDDVEFMFDPETGVTHVRSASRLGYSDMGKNRERIEEIRSLIEDQ